MPPASQRSAWEALIPAPLFLLLRAAEQFPQDPHQKAAPEQCRCQPDEQKGCIQPGDTSQRPGAQQFIPRKRTAGPKQKFLPQRKTEQPRQRQKRQLEAAPPGASAFSKQKGPRDGFRIKRETEIPCGFRCGEKILPVKLAVQASNAGKARQRQCPPQDPRTAGKDVRLQLPARPQQQRQNAEDCHGRKLLPAHLLCLPKRLPQLCAKPYGQKQTEQLGADAGFGTKPLFPFGGHQAGRKQADAQRHGEPLQQQQPGWHGAAGSDALPQHRGQDAERHGGTE